MPGRLYSIDTFTSSDRIYEFHYLMFHGLSRQLDATGEESIHRFGGDLSVPARLKSNAYNIPDISIRSTNLIVSDRVREAIGQRPNVSFCRVIFEKMIHYPYRPGDFSYYNTPEFLRNPNKYDPKSLFDRLPHRPDLVAAVGPYWEVVVPVLSSVAGSYKPTFQLRCEPSDIDGEIELDLSADLLKDYCMFWCECNFFDSSIYEAIRSYVNLDYFTLNTYDLNV